MSKAIEVVFLSNIEGANLNAAGTEGVISVLKKVSDVDGQDYIRVSGQSMKYHIRNIWREEGLPVSEIRARAEKGEKIIVSSGDPVKYIDDDLFGYMLAGVSGEKNRKRTAAVRMNGMISLFPYRGDRDFGVRYDPHDPMGKHNLYEVELSSNLMRGNCFIELDRVGKFDRWELGKEEEYEKSKEEKEKTVKAFFDALFHYFGGAHLTNYFTKMYPEVMLVVFLNRKLPVVGDKLRVLGKRENGKDHIDINSIEEVFLTFDESIDEIWLGCFESCIANLDAIKKIFEKNEKVKISTMRELMEKVKGKSFFE